MTAASDITARTMSVLPCHGGYHAVVTDGTRRWLGPVRRTEDVARRDGLRMIEGRHVAGCSCCDYPAGTVLAEGTVER